MLHLTVEPKAGVSEILRPPCPEWKNHKLGESQRSCESHATRSKVKQAAVIFMVLETESYHIPEPAPMSEKVPNEANVFQGKAIRSDERSKFIFLSSFSYGNQR